MVKTTTNYYQNNPTGREVQQSEDIHIKFNKLFEMDHTIKNTEVKIQIKPGCYPIQQKARPLPYHLQQDVKIE